MTKEFDKRNAAKSRKVCEAMAEAASTGKRVLTERERHILDMWPRFEDGEPVMVGDRFIDHKVNERTVRSVIVNNDGVELRTFDGTFDWHETGERVKRPVQSVLDADGVEIKVGDRIYSIENGNSYTVRSINGSGTIEFKGFDDKGWFPKYFTHMQPAIDADGVLIKVGDTVWFKGNPRPYAVVEVKDGSVRLYSKTHCSEESATSVFTDILTHIAPDSWERLEEDAEFNDETGIVGGNLDIVRRAKALAGVEVDE